jgi:hypothetical protein
MVSSQFLYLWALIVNLKQRFSTDESSRGKFLDEVEIDVYQPQQIKNKPKLV